MKFIVYFSVPLIGLLIFFCYSHNLFFAKTIASPKQDAVKDNMIVPNRVLINPKLQSESQFYEINQNLYDSISSGMSYEEVSAIFGWSGVLIYENEINSGEGIIQEKIYQWNNQDIYHSEISPDRIGEINPYWTITLQFQNDSLVGKTYSNLQP